MRIAVAQICSISGQLDINIRHHLQWINYAVDEGCDAIFFPELSLTNYEPTLAAKLAMDSNDERLTVFRTKSIKAQVLIAVGVPTKKNDSTNISMIIFHPDSSLQVYSKQYLHDDELPYFDAGTNEFDIIATAESIAPAICYELVIDRHLESAIAGNASIYLACVAKTAKGVTEGVDRLSTIATKHQIYSMMANAIGPADNFINAGGSAVWGPTGKLLAQLDSTSEGLLILDTKTGQVKNVPKTNLNSISE